ncbi:MAG: (d)CMP kinase [Firmicutes bacterium]|nr:(d)CMP kinase [Bacillota bacterium]
MKIAIDGPAGSGKSTIARLVAKELNLRYLDTGAMYRALTLQALRANIPLDNQGKLVALLNSTDLEVRFQAQGGDNLLLINGEDVTDSLRQPIINENVSLVSSHQLVREIIVSLQKEIAKEGSIVMDGRDIGTVVMPDACWKIFLEASREERARRRRLELKEKGHDLSLEDLVQQIQRRDFLDSTRESSPLKKAEDAVEIDTTFLTIEEVVERVLQLVVGGRKHV